MKEYAKKPENASRTLDSNPRASKQAPISQILQAYKDRIEGKPVQRQSVNEEELLQVKAAQQDYIRAVLQKYKERNIQRYAPEEDEELIQGKFDTAQREEIDEEEILQGKFESAPTTAQEPVQREEKPNNTGLPDNLKTGIENLSGYSMDDVKVHYNSDKPAQLNALAYTQGTDIHVAPGQEKHLPHEAWHVVQQKQGRVQPTTELHGVSVNDNQGLEKEADGIGNSILQKSNDYSIGADLKYPYNNTNQVVLQAKFGFEIETQIIAKARHNTTPTVTNDVDSNVLNKYPIVGKDKLFGFDLHIDHSRSKTIYEFVTDPPYDEAIEDRSTVENKMNRMKDVALLMNRNHTTLKNINVFINPDIKTGWTVYAGDEDESNQQSAKGYVQCTFGVKLSKIPEVFQKVAEEISDSQQVSEILTNVAGNVTKIETAILSYLGKTIDMKDKKIKELIGLIALIENYLFSYKKEGKSFGLGKNLIGQFFYKTPLSSLVNTMTDHSLTLLQDESWRDYVLKLILKDTENAETDSIFHLNVKDYIMDILSGTKDKLFDELKNPYSNAITDNVGKVGSQEQAIVMEDRRTVKKKWQERSLLDNLNKKFEPNEWPALALKFYDLLKTMNDVVK